MTVLSEQSSLTEDLGCVCAEVQLLKSSVLQLQGEKDRQRAQLEQDKESQLSNLREKLLTQTQHLESFQARVSDLLSFHSTLNMEVLSQWFSVAGASGLTLPPFLKAVTHFQPVWIKKEMEDIFSLSLSFFLP